MKKFKKMFAVMLSLAMVLGMSLTTFAEGTKPTEKDSALVKIDNVEAGSTLTAYQIIDADYNDVGFVRYNWVEGAGQTGEVKFTGTGDNAVVNGLTSDMITNLAKDPSALEGAKYENFDPKTTKLEVGTWMILVTPKANASKIYNPMVVSVYYTVDNDGNTVAAAGSVDASTNWGLATNDAFAKSSEVKVEKAVDQSSQEVGGIVAYTITGTIPSYGAEYENPSYAITDSYTNLYDQSVPEVKINGETKIAGTDYTYTPGNDSFTIEILNVSDYANKTEAERAVVITYTAKIAASASVNNPATNTANVNYTHTPGSNPTPGTPTSTYTYTFDIADMFQKVGNKNAVDEVGLAGATFGLFKGDETTPFKTYTTEKDTAGIASIHFEDLAAGTYTMKETAAPEGYSVSDKEYTIKIEILAYDNENAKDRKVIKYSVTISCEKEEPQTHIYAAGENGTFSKVENSDGSKGDVIVVQNTTLSTLPSTGGIGTTIFTIGGCVIMIVAAGLFFASRRKSAK